MSFTREQVAQIYVATFNRAPDAAGLNYWVNDSGFTNIEDVASSFFDSDEAAVMYPSGTSNTVMVQSAYQNLFGRDADADGLAYWVGELDAGNFSQSLMLQAMINGAQDTPEFGNDATMMANKTSVGVSFADAGQSNVNDASSIMAGVTDDMATVDAAELDIDELQGSTISVETGFTQEYLDGKTFYSVSNWKDSINDADDWVIVKSQYDGTNNNFNEYLPSTNTYDSLEIENYDINNGVITNYPTDGNGDFSIQITAIDSEKITILTTASDDWFITEYLYFSETNAIDALADLQEPTISVDNGFTEEWLDGRTLWTIDQSTEDGNTNLYTFNFDNNMTSAQTGISDTVTIPEFDFNYSITNDGIIMVDELDNYEYYKILSIDGTKISVSEGEDLFEVVNETVADQWFFTSQTDAQIFYDLVV